MIASSIGLSDNPLENISNTYADWSNCSLYNASEYSVIPTNGYEKLQKGAIFLVVSLKGAGDVPVVHCLCLHYQLTRTLCKFKTTMLSPAPVILGSALVRDVPNTRMGTDCQTIDAILDSGFQYGELVSISGESGSGKTLVVKILD